MRVSEIRVKRIRVNQGLGVQNNTWNIRRLVYDLFVQLAQRPSVNLS